MAECYPWIAARVAETSKGSPYLPWVGANTTRYWASFGQLYLRDSTDSLKRYRKSPLERRAPVRFVRQGSYPWQLRVPA